MNLSRLTSQTETAGPNGSQTPAHAGDLARAATSDHLTAKRHFFAAEGHAWVCGKCECCECACDCDEPEPVAR